MRAFVSFVSHLARKRLMKNDLVHDEALKGHLSRCEVADLIDGDLTANGGSFVCRGSHKH